MRVHQARLNKAFVINWKKAPVHSGIRYILQRLKPAEVEQAFRQHAADVAPPGTCAVALDGKVLKQSFDAFNDQRAKQVLSAFATNTALVLAHADIDDKSNEIPAVQQLLNALGLKDHVVTPDTLHCQKNL
jgi:hypothetical protein